MMKLDELWRISMKTSLFIVFAVLFGVSTMFTQQKQVIVRVKNPSGFNRQGEIVSVRWEEMRALFPTLDPGRISVHEMKSSIDLVYQVVPHAGSGAPEKLLFQSDFNASEVKDFRISQSSEKHEFKSLTDARFVPPREDLAWENDRIAFRMYGPPLAKEGSNNGIDVWTKRVRSLIVEKWYEGEEQKPPISYHEDHGEGADYFSVGSSLGVGACALLKGDSLYQPGVFQKHRIISTGPLQAIFELTYNPVLYEGKKITEVMRITLSAGVNLNKIDVTFSAGSEKGKAAFATGIVKRKGTKTTADQNNGWTSLWGLTTENEEIGYLGTGIVIPGARVKEMKENAIHALIVGNVELGKTLTYYAGAGWTRSGDFSSEADWNKYLSTFAQKVRSPLVATISAK
jgi:pectinesterase